MYINKSNKGIGWYSYVKKNQHNEKVENAPTLNFVFKKGTEPQEESIEGDLFLITKDGSKRLVLPYVNEWQDSKRIEFRIMGGNQDADKFGGDRADAGKSVDLQPDDLPFY